MAVESCALAAKRACTARISVGKATTLQTASRHRNPRRRHCELMRPCERAQSMNNGGATD
jgi:hypothetical protein